MNKEETRPTKTRLVKELPNLINAEHRLCLEAAGAAFKHAVRCGDLLIEAKSNCDHGEWTSWLQDHFDGSARSARSYMQVASNRELIESKRQSSAVLSVDGALKLLASPNESEIEGAELPPEPSRLDDPEFVKGLGYNFKDDDPHKKIRAQMWVLFETAKEIKGKLQEAHDKKLQQAHDKELQQISDEKLRKTRAEELKRIRTKEQEPEDGPRVIRFFDALVTAAFRAVCDPMQHFGKAGDMSHRVIGALDYAGYDDLIDLYLDKCDWTYGGLGTVFRSARKVLESGDSAVARSIRAELSESRSVSTNSAKPEPPDAA